MLAISQRARRVRHAISVVDSARVIIRLTLAYPGLPWLTLAYPGLPWLTLAYGSTAYPGLPWLLAHPGYMAYPGHMA